MSLDDQNKTLDEKINHKIAIGMKKAVHLILGKFDMLIHDKVQLLVSQEFETHYK